MHGEEAEKMRPHVTLAHTHTHKLTNQTTNQPTKLGGSDWNSSELVTQLVILKRWASNAWRRSREDAASCHTRTYTYTQTNQPNNQPTNQPNTPLNRPSLQGSRYQEWSCWLFVRKRRLCYAPRSFLNRPRQFHLLMCAWRFFRRTNPAGDHLLLNRGIAVAAGPSREPWLSPPSLSTDRRLHVCSLVWQMERTATRTSHLFLWRELEKLRSSKNRARELQEKCQIDLNKARHEVSFVVIMVV